MSDCKRVKKGVAEGGQFATTHKSEDLSVQLAQSADVMLSRLQSAVHESIQAIEINIGDLGMTAARARNEKERRVWEAAQKFTSELGNLDDEAAFDHLYACVKAADDPDELQRRIKAAIQANNRA